HPAPSPTIGSDFSLATSRSVLDMPVEGSRRAPKCFRGEAADVEPFLRKYERLALSYHLTEQEKCETITDYCGRIIRETIEGFPSYQRGAWTQLKEDIRIHWNADLESKRFRIKDLQRFTGKFKEEPIIELRDWRHYLRSFVRIAGWLQGRQKISNTDYAYYMWIGIHKAFRKRLEARILLEDPRHNMATPFDPDAIDKAAKALLSVDRFDTERLGSRRFHEEQSDDEDSDQEDTGPTRRRNGRDTPIPGRKVSRFDEEDEDENDSEGEEEQETRKKRLQKYTKEQHEKVKEGPLQEASQTGAPQRKAEDIELDALIKQLHTLQLDDPQYGAAYLKACRIDPNVQQCFYQPILRPPPRFNQNVPRDLPPHMQRPGMNQMGRPPARPPLPPTGNQGCYGCGQPGHMISNCPELQKFISKGQVLRDYRGRITNKDGQLIRRNDGETIVQAIERVLPKVNFIAYGGPLEEEDNDEELEVEEADVMVYPVERSQKNVRPYRKQAFDGVGIPSREKDKDKQKKADTPTRANSGHQFPMQRLVPVETQPVTFDPNKDIDMIDDRTQTQGPKKRTTSEPSATEKGKWVARASDVSKTVDPAKIAEKLLDLPVTLQVRDIAGSSREIASSLIDMLKLKKADIIPATALGPAAHLITSRTGSLIRLQMECNFKPVTFIVDTGSQLNIISEKVCKNIVRKPINTGEAITMNDANGGTGRLLGLVEDIPLKLGHITTPISAYVAENPPFDGLLGRPWQQAHKIGIEEREDGTYLLF
ncbi:hypothetical protein C2E23DRAFT_684497, partial [Lenzites betulinus]